MSDIETERWIWLILTGETLSDEELERMRLEREARARLLEEATKESSDRINREILAPLLKR